MFSKLTLRLEKSVIEDAKAWSEKNETSLSHAVSMFFQILGKAGKEKIHLDPWTKKLMGIAGSKGKPPISDEAVRDSYLDYIQEKHK